MPNFNSPILDTDIVDITIGVIMKCGLLAKAYLKIHEHLDTVRTWLDFEPFWSSKLKLRRITMITAGQMDFSMNAAKTHAGEEFDKQMDSFVQAHLAGQDTTNSELSALKQQSQMITQQMG